ncbi:MAG: OmpH family outer membrane protein [Planctomyces sp.]|nr:OmpH family outer membrane protein [Planctomyces sp.]
MKKFVCTLLAAIAVATVSQAQAQNAPAAGAPRTAAPAAGKTSYVGLIDMAEVFQGYKKFEALRNELQAEIEKSDQEAKAKLESLQALQAEINEKKFAPGSPQFEQAERQLLDGKGEFEAFRAATQRKLARRESEMFKVIYSDTTNAVAQYANFKNYSMIIRFDRKGIDENTPPQEAVQRMNKQVVFHRPEDDVTDIVLKYLNSEYEKSRGQVPARAASSGAPATK